jgi:hypothetical protein
MYAILLAIRRARTSLSLASSHVRSFSRAVSLCVYVCVQHLVRVHVLVEEVRTNKNIIRIKRKRTNSRAQHPSIHPSIHP